MQDNELKPAEQSQHTTTPTLDQSRVGRMTNDVSTITDLAEIRAHRFAERQEPYGSNAGE